MIQAFIKSRQLGTNYSLKRFNKSYFYTLATIVFFVMNVAFPLLIAKFALSEMTPYHPFRSEGAKQRYLEFYDEIAKDWPVESKTRMIDTSYGRTFVRISGPVDAPPLVLMHGANATSLSWMPNIKALSRSYRTYAVDNIVFLAPAATVLPLGVGFIKPALISILPHRHFVKKGVYFILEDLWKKDETSRAFAEQWVDHLDLGLRSFKPKMMVSPTVLSDEELRSLKMPVFVMVGENEKIYPPYEAVERLKSIAPNIKTEIIPGAGHDLSVVQAEMVNQKILDFLEKRKNSP